jgi:hypothetical protein
MAKEKRQQNAGIQLPVEQEGWVSVMALQDDAVPVSAMICNWDLHDPELADLVFLADQPAAEKSDDLIGKVIPVKWWICTKLEIPDRQNGGTCFVVRSALIAPDRKILSTLSVGVLKSIELIRKTVGTGEIDPPFVCRVVGTKVGTGSDMLTLVPINLVQGK